MSKTHPIPEECPVCKGTYVVSQLRCKSCDTKLEGNFGSGAFANLNDKQIRFITAFLRNKGNIQNTGKELGISYPTVKSRLDNALSTMGLLKENDEDIFAKVKAGEMTIEEAVEIIASNKR